MTREERKRYHHGRLRETLIAAAVAEVEAVGASGLSMREIARRAGVSHAAPAHHFVDKAGIFTAIAAEGFRLAAQAIGPRASGEYGFLEGGQAYVAFALAHPGHFEVMFRPALYHADDPDLQSARAAAFDVLYGSARALVAESPDADVTGLVLAGWSISHGFSTLVLSANIEEHLDPTGADVNELLLDGLITLGRFAEQQRSQT